MDARPLSRSLSRNMKEQIRLQSGNHVHETVANDKCSMTLTLFSGVARPGDTIAGSVDLQVRQKFSLRAVCVMWYGYEEVDFTAAKSCCQHLAKLNKAGGDTDFDLSNLQLKRSKKKIHHPLLDTTMTLWGKKGKLMSDDIEPGDYTFPFTFVLPTDVAAYSYFDRFGTVTYQATGFLDMPILKKNVRVSVPFAVASPGVDPVAYQRSRENPTHHEVQKIVKMLCLPRGRVVLQAILPAHALLSDEMFTVMMNITNHTKVDVKGVIVDIVTNLAYKNKKKAAPARMRQRKRVIVPDSQIPAKTTQDKMVHISFPMLSARIPLLPTYCSDLIERYYTVEIRLLARHPTRTSPEDLMVVTHLQLHQYKGLPTVPNDGKEEKNQEDVPQEVYHEAVNPIHVYVPAPLDTFDLKEHRSVYPELPVARYEAVPQPLPRIDAPLSAYHPKPLVAAPEVPVLPPRASSPVAPPQQQYVAAEEDAPPPAYVAAPDAHRPLFGEDSVAEIDVADDREKLVAQENIHQLVEGEGYVPAVPYEDKPLPQVPQHAIQKPNQERDQPAVIALS